MADVQVEKGFVRVANDLYWALMRSPMPGQHLRCTHALISLLYGYQKTQDRIAASQVAELVGIGPKHAARILRDLKRWGVVRELEPGTFRLGALIELVKDFDRWTVGQTRDADNRSRRKAAGVGEAVPPDSGVGEAVPGGGGGPPEVGEAVPLGVGEAVPTRDKRQLKDKEKRAERAKRQTLAPKALTPEDRAALEDWAKREEPWCLPKLDDLIRVCLLWHDSKGSKHVLWVRAVQTWIIRQRTDFGQQGSGPGGKRNGRPGVTADLDMWGPGDTKEVGSG